MESYWTIPPKRSRIRLLHGKIHKRGTSEHSTQQGPLVYKWELSQSSKVSPKFCSLRGGGGEINILDQTTSTSPKFYGAIILKKIRYSIGKLLKIDACIGATLLGRYAGLCKEVPLNKPVKSHINIGNYKQQIKYKGKDQLCHGCGRIGNPQRCCSPILAKQINNKSQLQYSNELKTVAFEKLPT